MEKLVVTATTKPPIFSPLATFFVVTALAAGLLYSGRSVPFIGENLHAMIAVIFLYAPFVASWMTGQRFDFEHAGLRWSAVLPGMRFTGLACLLTWPLFFAAFFLLYTTMCGAREGAGLWSSLWVSWREIFAESCVFWNLDRAALRWPSNFLMLSVTQVLVIALPEEFFFRGYLYKKFEERWPPLKEFLGAKVGMATVFTSLLFALGHVGVDFDLRRLTVFFPGLVFAWMRARTGSIVAGTFFHALCNLYSDVVYRSFFWSAP